MYECEEVDFPPVVSSCDTSEMLEFVEAALDAVARLVDGEVVGDQRLAGGIAGYDRRCAGGGDEVAQGVAVVGLVGEDMLRFETFEQGRCLWCITGLAGCQNDAKRPSQGICGKMDLGGQSTSGAPQSLVLGPPFPVAACWCARTRVVSSIRYSLCRSAAR